MKLLSVKSKFHNEWVAFLFTNKFKGEGKVIAHHKDRHTLHKKLKGKRSSGLYITFAGSPLPKEYAVILSIIL